MRLGYTLVLWLVALLVVASGCTNVDSSLNSTEVNDDSILTPQRLPSDYLVVKVKDKVVEDVQEETEDEFESEYEYETFERYSRPQLIIHILDIDSGSAIFIRTPDEKAILVNTAGEFAGEKVARLIKEYGYDKLDAVILSDHNVENVGGYPALVEEIKVERTFYNGNYYNTKYFRNFVDAAKGHSLNMVDKDFSLELDSFVDIDIIIPYDTIPLKTSKVDNILVRVRYENFSMLIAGHCLEACENVFVEEGTDVKAKVIRVAESGSKYGNTPAFLNMVDPEYAIIEQGVHASIDLLDFLRENDVTVYDTDKKRGDIVITSDGLKFDFSFPEFKKER
ncbi:hypothetical protein HN698_06120 [Candidatus Woesearchaeota archaeon]|nr:hypothetical protein [Candidatus Woesearchaeota archaeon]MBT4697998.1 hypothetical protein [Candidatus Woesearchaeota archaeon]MBT4717661.1 hypothetical protein [Candidatus Woesearchaeota archaeon]MBT7105536.1 hypothetical protein [Candidatus Woesearchaeota archaeon]MBT7931464.1 hypothetical protein [Candidatus Woesearchaeota archaeon]